MIFYQFLIILHRNAIDFLKIMCYNIYRKENFCLVRVIIVFIIQHIIQGNSTPYVDCRPPALRKKGARSIRAFTHLLRAGFMHYMTARRIFLPKIFSDK